MVEVRLFWAGSGEKVEIAGEFSNWEPRLAEKRTSGWEVKLTLGLGSYQYKWVIDGSWLVDESKPTALDQGGNKNNLLIVEESESSGDSDSWERVSMDECGPENPTTTPQQDQKTVPEESGTKLDQTSSVLIERMFSPEPQFETKMSQMGEKINETNFTDIYYDTADFKLLIKGVWLKRRDDEWKLSFLEEKGVEAETSTRLIQERLATILGEDGGTTLEDVVHKYLRESMRLNGRIVTWRVEPREEGSMEVELRLEGGVHSARLRSRGEYKGTLCGIYTFAKELGLNTFKLE